VSNEDTVKKMQKSISDELKFAEILDVGSIILSAISSSSAVNKFSEVEIVAAMPMVVASMMRTYAPEYRQKGVDLFYQVLSIMVKVQ
jgi:hypothetical protein